MTQSASQLSISSPAGEQKTPDDDMTSFGPVGASWNNKKWFEERDYVMRNLVDQEDYDPKKYGGDPLMKDGKFIFHDEDPLNLLGDPLVGDPLAKEGKTKTGGDSLAFGGGPSMKGKKKAGGDLLSSDAHPLTQGGQTTSGGESLKKHLKIKPGALFKKSERPNVEGEPGTQDEETPSAGGSTEKH